MTFSSYSAWPSDRESRAVLSDPALLAASAATLTCAAGMMRQFLGRQMHDSHACTHGMVPASLHIQANSALSQLGCWRLLEPDHRLLSSLDPQPY